MKLAAVTVAPVLSVGADARYSFGLFCHFWRKEEGTCFILIPEIAESFVIDSDEKGDSVQ